MYSRVKPALHAHPASRLFLPCLATVSLFAILTACASVEPKTNGASGVSVRALNYSAREVSMIGVIAPGNPKNEGGGDALNPYGAGGAICCFSIPHQWHPDLKVIVEYQFYPEEQYRKALVSVPPYPDGKPGDIWLIVHADESAEAVVSNYGPSRPEWPGKIKGYPVPSREYRLKLWERKLRQEKTELAAMKKAVQSDIRDLTLEELMRLERAIRYSEEEVKRLEGTKP